MYQNAYEEYQNDRTKEQSKFEAVTADKAFDYAAYLQQVQLDQAKAQQDFENAMLLDKEFGTGEPTMPDLDGMTPGKDTTYSYGQGSAYKDALDAVVNQEDFVYAHREDPLYGALRKSALREADRETADKLAEINARTGGVASSYGVRAASDAGNQYNQELNASIPGLRKTAYQEYLGDFEGKLQGLGALQADRDFDYAKWLQDYQLKEAAKQQEFQNALAMYERYGLTPEIAAILGVPYEEPSSGGSRYGNRKLSDGGDDLTAEDVLNEIVKGSGSQSSKNKTINSVINDAVKAGAISKQKAQELKKTYVGGSGGRYAY